MPLTIEATPGASNANSYETLEEFKDYIANRLRVPTLVSLADDLTLAKALVMATRGLDRIATKFRRLEIQPGRLGMLKFYLIRPYWTGTPTTISQSLAWPREGMFDRNNNPILNNVIPQDLKDAESEFGILAITTDLTADNSIVVQGISEIQAGPVDITFKEYIQIRAFPNPVSQALVPSWLTDETYQNIPQARFGTVGIRS